MEILSVKHKGGVNKLGFGEKAFFNLNFPALGLVLSRWSLFISNSSPQSWRSFSPWEVLPALLTDYSCARVLWGVHRVSLCSSWGSAHPKDHPRVAQSATPQRGWVPTWHEDQILLQRPPYKDSDSSKLPSSLSGQSFLHSGMHELFPRWVRGLCPPRVVAVLMFTLSLNLSVTWPSTRLKTHGQLNSQSTNSPRCPWADTNHIHMHFAGYTQTFFPPRLHMYDKDIQQSENTVERNSEGDRP